MLCYDLVNGQAVQVSEGTPRETAHGQCLTPHWDMEQKTDDQRAGAPLLEGQAEGLGAI